MRLASLLLLFVMASPVVARAQAVDTDEARTEEARGAFERGVAAYESGSFEEALVAFQRAHALTGNAELLFNIGTVADRLRRDAIALEAYEGYLAAYPGAADRANIEARIAAIRAAHPMVTPPAAEPTPSLPSVADPAPPLAPTPRDQTGEHVLLGTSVVLLAAGAALVIASFVELANAESADTWAALSGPYERVPILSAVGWTTFGVGAAALAVYLGWSLSASSESGTSARLRLGPSGISVDGTF